MLLLLPRRLELLRQGSEALRRALDRPPHARVLHALCPLGFLETHRAASGRGGGEFGVGEIKRRHARMVAPPGARVHAVPADEWDWIA
jgi:hypothetical protein